MIALVFLVAGFSLLVLLQVVLLLVFLSKYNEQKKEYTEKEDSLSKMMEEIKRKSEEGFLSSQNIVEKNRQTINSYINESFVNFSNLLENKISNSQVQNAASFKDVREEVTQSLNIFQSRFGENVKDLEQSQKEKISEFKVAQEKLNAQTMQMLESLRGAVEAKLLDIQKDNSTNLEKIRETVDEKLHNTLETRIKNSFQLVSEKLETVQKGLGEMSRLATDVGDLKKVLSNVKKTGMLGEYQLEAILCDVLNPSQYEKNIATKHGSADRVEYAIKIPSKNEEEKDVLIPLDSKFPTSYYIALTDAYDAGDAKKIKDARLALQNELKTFAKDISKKYIDVPNTTDFAMMFLPTEGLYAEALSSPELFQNIYRSFKVIMTGPTTTAAFLNSLQVGFRTIAVQKKTSEIKDVLNVVRSEFDKFSSVLERTKKYLESASKEIEEVEKRRLIMQKKLKNVEIEE